MLGETISHYRLDEKLGEGGMGIVYRARDLQLNRNVAIKFLSSNLADVESRRRFQQEAQTASSLNHPHILSVFEAGEADGRQYLVTEYIEGWTLREWARQTNPSLRHIVDLLVGPADGLACAHQAGIVHRDIKPENLLVSKDGYAKVADFGLAKLLETGRPDAETLTLGTNPGMLRGTVPYMSPEQAAGRLLDARSDIFSFAVVLYELLAGRRPFRGNSDIDVMHSILHDTPTPLTELGPEIPYELRVVVEKALEKDPADRYQSMRELTVDLKRIQRLRTSETKPVLSKPGRRLPWRPRAALTAVILLAAGLLVWQVRKSGSSWENPLANARITRLTDWEGTERDAAISPDGKFVTFVADRDGPFDAWVSQVGSGAFVNVTRGRFPALLDEIARCVGFAGDSTQVWVRGGGQDPAGKPVATGTWLIPTLGGTPRHFIKGINAAWSPEGSRVVYFEGPPPDPTFVADRQGSNARQIYAGEPGAHCHYQTWSPDGRYIYFVKNFRPREADVWRVSAGGGQAEQLTHHNSHVTFPTLLDDRTLLYTARAEDGSGYWLYAMDVERRTTHRLSIGVEQYISVAASADGKRVVATVANPSGSLWTAPLGVSVAPESATLQVSLPTARAVGPRYGPSYFVYLSSTGGDDGLWKFQEGSSTELWKGSDGAVVAAPAISRDGRQIAFIVRGKGGNRLQVMGAEGTGVRQLAESLDVRDAPSWSADGESVVIAAEENRQIRLFRVPVRGGPPIRLTSETSLLPVWSPDGSFILYSGGDNGPAAVTPDGKPFPLRLPRLMMRGGSTERYRFLPNGKGLVVLQGEYRRQNFYWVDPASGEQRQLTDLKPGFTITGFDISPDGRQILFDRVRENSDIVLIDLGR